MAKRAPVLGGGGPVGIAWEAGLLAGLAEAGADISDADYIVGTSAGSFVGGMIATGRTPAALVAPMLAETAPPARASSSAQISPEMMVLFTKMQEAISGERPAQEVRAELGAWALKAKTMPEEEFMANFGRPLSEFPEHGWPQRDFACTAVDASDGSFILWNRASGVGLSRAIASSCAVPGIFPPITIKGRRYIDGGMRSPTNADLVKGYETVVVVRVVGAAADPVMAARFRKLINGELDVLRRSGARVELVSPDESSLEAFGINLMDPSRRPGAAKAGVAQGRAEAARLRAAWNG